MRRRRGAAPGRALPEPVTGETMVASTANCAPCQSGSPSARRTPRATCAPASWQTRATARSNGGARGQAWMLHRPSGGRRAHRGARGSGMPEAQAAGAGASGARGGHKMLTSGLVGSTVRACEAYGPACDSSSARDAKSTLAESISSAHTRIASGRSPALPAAEGVLCCGICGGAASPQEGTAKARSRGNSAALEAAPATSSWPGVRRRTGARSTRFAAKGVMLTCKSCRAKKDV